MKPFIKSTDEGTPNSLSRVNTLMASETCKVLKVLRPESTNCLMLSALSTSLTSPTITTSGSWRKVAATKVVKIEPF